MIKKIKESISVFVVKNPASSILIAILVLNALLFVLSATLISALAPKSLEDSGFWASVYYTVCMVLDAGCISAVIEDIGQTNVWLILVCIATVLIGMITFTGAVIGYVTNYISSFIDNSKSGMRSVKVSKHTVILNWNSRASEIINDLLYSGKKETIIVLVSENGATVEREINDRISETLKRDLRDINRECEHMSFLNRIIYKSKYKTRNRLTVIVKEGDTYSTKQLNDISILQASTVIILGRDIQNSMCKYDIAEKKERLGKGNTNTLKTLVQVAEMTSGEDSADDQIIIVEVEDDWTLKLVNDIISYKEQLGKCNIIPVSVNQILGQILSQFSIMPELNSVYSDLFSNRGAEFFCKELGTEETSDKEVAAYLGSHMHSIPMSVMNTKTGPNLFFVAEDEKDIDKVSEKTTSSYKVKLNKNYWLEQRNVVILGHNSKSADIIKGFDSFSSEWKHNKKEILNIIVIDDKKSLEKLNYYKGIPYVKQVIEADIYDAKTICDAINTFVDSNIQDTSILILSDDTVTSDDIDASVLTYLIYVQSIITERERTIKGFDRESIDVVAEILNPKNYDVVHNYSVNNVIISNRYISKMVTQISRKSELFEFYQDILSYDEDADTDYSSKELYIKKVSRFFDELPGKCTAAELIRAVYDAGPADNKSVVIGYVRPGGKMVLFTGDQRDITVELTLKDKLILFSNH